LCLGNSDAHGKNISFFIDAARNLSLTPFYDIVNIHLYPHYAHELAMAFGDEFEIGQIKAYDLAYHCRLLNIKPALLITRFHTITKQIHKGLETRTLMDPLLEINAPFCEQYTQDVLTRIEKLNDVFEALKNNSFEGYF
jgi:serine/threonine-protein kinase HipA